MVAIHQPPTIRELLADPEYKRYFLQAPRIPDHLNRDGQAWQVWVRVEKAQHATGVTYAWRGTRHGSYREAIAEGVQPALRLPNMVDVAVVSRRVSFMPPDALTRLIPRGRTMDWCRRCRRPSSFDTRMIHHALVNAPAITTDDPERCFYCGGRRITFGTR